MVRWEGREVEDGVTERVRGFVRKPVRVVHEVGAARIVKADSGGGGGPTIVAGSGQQGVVGSTGAQQRSPVPGHVAVGLVRGAGRIQGIAEVVLPMVLAVLTLRGGGRRVVQGIRVAGGRKVGKVGMHLGRKVVAGGRVVRPTRGFA